MFTRRVSVRAVDRRGAYSARDRIAAYAWMHRILLWDVVFDQLSELESRGLISGARLNSWVTGQSMEDAQAEIDAVQAQKAKTAAALLQPEDLEPGGGINNAVQKKAGGY